MRSVAVALAVFAVAASAALATPPGPGEPGASVVARPARAAAQPARLILKLRYEMICGLPGRGPVIVTLPAAMRLPATIERHAVRVHGRAAPSVAVAGHVVTVGLPEPPPVTCQSITLGTLRITFTRAAGLGNPAAPGSYPVLAQVGPHAFSATLAIRR